MKDEVRLQYLVWVGIAVVALLGIGLIAFLLGRLSTNEAASIPTPSPSPTITPLPTPVVTRQGLQSIVEFSTVEYTAVSEVYNENLPDGWLDELLGTKERLLMLVYGEVKAGFDLSKLTEENLWADGTRVRLVLPAPEILSSSIDFDRTHIVFYENTLLLDQNNPNLQGDALARAKESIEHTALEDNILDKANEYGKTYFENYLYSLGFTDVEVVVDAQIFKE